MEGVDPQRVIVGEQRQDVVDPALDVGLTHPELDLLVEHGQHGQRVGHPAVHAADRDRAASAHDVDGHVQGVEAIQPCALHHLLGERVRQQ